MFGVADFTCEDVVGGCSDRSAVCSLGWYVVCVEGDTTFEGAWAIEVVFGIGRSARGMSC